MLDSAQDLVAVFLSLAFVWLLSGRLALGKQREPRERPQPPRRLDLPALAGVRAAARRTSDSLIRPKLRSEEQHRHQTRCNDLLLPSCAHCSPRSR